jgi:hypothetical protein
MMMNVPFRIQDIKWQNSAPADFACAKAFRRRRDSSTGFDAE